MTKYRIKIAGVPADVFSLPFGRQIEHRGKIEAFKRSAKITWLSIKRQSDGRAWREFLDCFHPGQWFACYQYGSQCRDDVIEVYYKNGA